MKKMILVLMVLLSLGQAKEHIVNTYTLKVEADATKVDGSSWDISGGAPDLLIKVDGVFLDFDKTCRNSYGCSVDFTVEHGTSWYFEIYDKDIASNDLIAKGNCSVGKECHFSGAKISISE